MAAPSRKPGFISAFLVSLCCLSSKWLEAETYGPLETIDSQAQVSLEPADYHHTRINSTDPVKSIQFYETVFNAQRIQYRRHSHAVLVDRALILFNKVTEPPPWKLESGLYHIGWGCKDTIAEFAWLRNHKVEVETPPRQLGQQYYLYAFGPSHELFEFYSGIPQPRFAHVHLMTEDVSATAKWYMENLGLRGPSRLPPKPAPPPSDFKLDLKNPLPALRFIWMTEVRTSDDVRINIFGMPGNGNFNWWTHSEAPPESLLPTAGRALNHIAFSFRNIQPVHDRMLAHGVEIVDDIKVREEIGYKSFFVLGPDQVTIEIVEERPIPEGSWE